MLRSTFDFNFDNVLSHAIDNGIKLSIEFIINHIESQAFDRNNYDIIMMNLEKLLDNNYGNYLRSFLNDTESSTTNIRIILEDERLDPNQSMTSVDYMEYDHNSLEGIDQVIKKFTDTVQKDKEAHKGGKKRSTFKV